MKIAIKSIKLEAQISFVTFTYIPNWWDRLWKRKIPPNFTERYVTEYDTYRSGGGNVYYDKDGDKLGNGSWVGRALDREYTKDRLKL